MASAAKLEIKLNAILVEEINRLREVVTASINSEALHLTNCSAFPDMPTTPGWYWVRSRIPDAPWFVCETHENENGVPEWRDDGESWPVEPNRADFVGPLIPPGFEPRLSLLPT